MVAQGSLLDDKSGADVCKVAGGGVLYAHANILSVHSEWFRARLEWLWEQGTGAGASAAAGSASSGGGGSSVCVIDAQEAPPAVMRALLQFVYSGRVVLENAEATCLQAASPEPGQPPAKRAKYAPDSTAATGPSGAHSSTPATPHATGTAAARCAVLRRACAAVCMPGGSTHPHQRALCPSMAGVRA